MSLELFVILASQACTSTAIWEGSLRAHKSPAHFTQAIDLTKHSGFTAVEVSGRKTGFYYGSESYSEFVSNYPSAPKVAAEKPVVYSLGYGGSLLECAAAFYSAAVLVADFGAEAFEPESGKISTYRELLDAATQCEELSVGEPGSAR